MRGRRTRALCERPASAYLERTHALVGPRFFSPPFLPKNIILFPSPYRPLDCNMCPRCRAFRIVPRGNEETAEPPKVIHPVRHVVQTTPQISVAELKKGQWYIGYEINRFPCIEAFFVGKFEAERKRSRGYCKYKISPSTYTFVECKVHSGIAVTHHHEVRYVERIETMNLCQEWEIRARDVEAESFFAERRGVINACSYCRLYELPVNGIMGSIRELIQDRTGGMAAADIFAGVSKYLGGEAYQERLANRYVHAQFARIPGTKRVREESL